MKNELWQYKAVLFDVDKTIAGAKQQLTPRTQRALQQLLESHFTIGLCTGRHFATLKPGVLKYFPKDALHIVAGGAQVID
ncbi:HAD hydrolase family protein, partial [Candidatus Woesebacteria bacterium]|nr:HAD hydrolase family protein [Candidatus Woesebacteria bacterium]